MRQIHHRRGAFSRPVERWGDIITCDHMVQTDEDWNMGLNGMRDVLTVKDIATGLTWAYPTASKSGDDTMEALTQFCGQWQIKCIYTDCSPEIADACRRLGYVHETNQPGVPQTNGIVERPTGRY